MGKKGETEEERGHTESLLKYAMFSDRKEFPCAIVHPCTGYPHGPMSPDSHSASSFRVTDIRTCCLALHFPSMCVGSMEAVPDLVGYALLKSGRELLTPPTAAELRLPTRVPLARPRQEGNSDEGRL